MKDYQRYHREFISCEQKGTFTISYKPSEIQKLIKSVYEVNSFLKRDEKADIPLALTLGFTLMKGQYSKCQLSCSFFGGELTFRVMLLDP